MNSESLLFPVGSFLDLLDTTGNWDKAKLCAIFHPDVVPYILGVKCPDPMDSDDQIVWRWSLKGNFEIKSTYSSLMNSTWDVACRHKLMTNLERYRRHIGHSSLCPSCGAADESVLHVLRDCHGSTAAWKLLLPPSLLLSFFQSDLHDWILHNLFSQLLCANGGPPWSSVFVSTLWQLWKGRNDLLFNNVRHTSNVIVHRALTWACYYSGSFPQRTPLAHYTCYAKEIGKQKYLGSLGMVTGLRTCLPS
ncbi:hypothetical protein V6N11_075615 [Hibiscus sabdariffa]|uniref:Reverse transcriptase zinc-binding domain-containing protein n=1 Tax=Hibiscus sabdariffa TaxID=183260 RepID=A0ABR2R731_9ROSI